MEAGEAVSCVTKPDSPGVDAQVTFYKKTLYYPL